jgi:hypothetical protein
VLRRRLAKPGFARRLAELLYGGQREEDGSGTEEDRRGREFSGAEEVAKDSEAHTERSSGGVRASVKESGEDSACCEKYADSAGDPAAEQCRAAGW